jgi:SAM-dependent methyltransferase
MSTSGAGFFETKYRRNADPWSFATNAYELSRYAAIVNALSHARYKRGFEPGCSIGVLTEQLAELCEYVEAVEFSPTAATAALKRCSGRQNVQVVCRALEDCLPIKGFDLLILSEIGYYFTPDAWRALTSQVIADCAPEGTILAAHWMGISPDHRMHGDQVHDIIRESRLLTLEYAECADGFRIDRWRRV